VTEAPGILILRHRVPVDELARLVRLYFEDMVKYVVDLRLGVIALGGELHADAEQLLLDEGSRQEDVWGANYYPGAGEEQCVEYTALINIRPSVGNRGMEIEDAAVRARVRELTFSLIGRGEPLP
jgi:hypothetical protein